MNRLKTYLRLVLTGLAVVVAAAGLAAAPTPATEPATASACEAPGLWDNEAFGRWCECDPARFPYAPEQLPPGWTCEDFGSYRPLPTPPNHHTAAPRNSYTPVGDPGLPPDFPLPSGHHCEWIQYYDSGYFHCVHVPDGHHCTWTEDGCLFTPDAPAAAEEATPTVSAGCLWGQDCWITHDDGQAYYYYWDSASNSHVLL